MSMYEDPPEPTEEEINEHEARQAAMRSPVKLEGLTIESVRVMIESLIEHRFGLREMAREAVDKAVQEIVKEALADKIDSVMDDIVRPEIARMVAEGWAKTDQWGHPQGQRVTLTDRLRAYLDGDHYHKPLDSVFKAELEKQLKTEAGKAFTAALSSLRAKVDEELNGRITKAFREALGMRS